MIAMYINKREPLVHMLSSIKIMIILWVCMCFSSKFSALGYDKGWVLWHQSQGRLICKSICIYIYHIQYHVHIMQVHHHVSSCPCLHLDLLAVWAFWFPLNSYPWWRGYSFDLFKLWLYPMYIMLTFGSLYPKVINVLYLPNSIMPPIPPLTHCSCLNTC